MPTQAIIATSYDSLGPTALALMKYGFKSILIEKPGALDWNGIKNLRDEAKINKAHLYIAYNRRFYSSVREAQKIIKKDGGVSSFHFEFTEWSHILTTLNKPADLMQRWFFHNSTHVVDMAFFLGGSPTKMSSFTAGSLPWHSKASSFSGAGTTKTGVLFAYNANWEAPGRWGVEIMTKKHRLIFRPLERLQIQDKGSVMITETKINNQLDLDYKPGLYKEVLSFLTDKKDLCTINEQCNNIKWYKKMLG
jgi:predicted dehydrogenase